MRPMTLLRPLVGCAFVCLLTACAAAQSPAPANSSGKNENKTGEWDVQANPARLVNGAPLLIEVRPAQALKSLAADWLGHNLVFSPTSGGRWLAFAGVSLETKAGNYALELRGEPQDGKTVAVSHHFEVAEEKYPTVELTVPTKFTAPSPEQMEIIKRDQELKQKVFARLSPEREWSGKFLAPVDAQVSDVFGTRRVFNGATKSVHQGLDFRVPPATPVAAVGAGTVILAQLLYFEGNCVVIDHGQGLLTLYLHLSELKVKDGDAVKAGQLVGLSGATGRATGPHLHLAVRWQGTYLDPAALLRLQVPAN